MPVVSNRALPSPALRKCSYGPTYRAHKRGQKYDGSIANYPEDSIVIVDMSTQSVKCQVAVPGPPSQVVWVPNEAQRVEGVGPAAYLADTKGASGAFTAFNLNAMMMAAVVAALA
jgi:hypothetical protein